MKTYRALYYMAVAIFIAVALVGITSRPVHGANTQPDPQPSHGQDCLPHGNGGINENHCEGDEPSTTPSTVPSVAPSPTISPSAQPSDPTPTSTPTSTPTATLVVTPTPIPMPSRRPVASADPTAMPTQPARTGATPPPTDTSAPEVQIDPVDYSALILGWFIGVGLAIVIVDMALRRPRRR